MLTLQTRQLSVNIDYRSILGGVTILFRPATWTAIVGPNGAGKSTLLRALAGLQSIQGEVLLGEKSLQRYSPQKLAKTISWLGQGETADLDLTVWETAMLGRLPHQGLFGGVTKLDSSTVESVLKQTRSWEMRHRQLGELSGGERQRVLIARALAADAPIILMDEPLTSLDMHHQVDWMHLIQKLTHEGRTIITVLHELPMALCATEMVILDKGQLSYQAACSSPALHRALEAVFEQSIAIHRVQDQWCLTWCR